MGKNEIIDYFNSVSGKTVTAKEIKQGLKSINKSLGQQVFYKIKNDVADNEGAFKKCCYFGNEPVFAMLKSKEQFSKFEQTEINKTESKKMQLNKMLIAKGVNTPKIYSLFFADKKYIEIQEKIAGEPMFIWAVESIANRHPELNNIMLKDKKTEVGKALFNYTTNSQEVLASLPQEKYDKFLNDLFVLNDCGLPADDTNSENILVSEKGFTIIDLDYESAVSELGLRKKTDNEIVCSFLQPFSEVLQLNYFYSNKEIDIISNNNIEITRKAVQAISNRNFAFNINNVAILNKLKNCMGTEFVSSLPYVLSSQYSLQRTKK